MILEPGTVGPNRAIGYQDTLRELRLQTRILMLKLREMRKESSRSWNLAVGPNCYRLPRYS